MKKILLLSITSLAMLMADFTLIGEQLTPVNEPVVETPPPIVEPTVGTSKYIEPITLPDCNANNPEVQFISSNADWSQINDSSKRIFCVKPGNYGSVTLNADGSANARRYILLDNDNDAHPASLSESAQANVQINLSGANYWTIDRMSTLNTSTDIAMNIMGTSQYNIINRIHMKNFNTYAITIYHGSHNNTIQNSRIAEQSLSGRKSDGVGIFFQNDVNWRNDTYIYNTKIIQNEFRNINDSIQLIRRWRDWASSDPVPTGYDGTIIDSNHIYLSPEIYTNGSGSSTPNGNFAYAENAIDLKAGSDDANNKIIITNNFMWGYRVSDTTGSAISSWGDAITIHYGVKNLIINNNYIFDSARAIGAGDSKGFSYGLSDSSISNNIMWDISDFDLVLWDANNLTVEGNIIHGANNWASFNSFTNSSLTNNVIINAGGNIGSLGSGSTISNTYNYASASDANQENLSFTTDVYTSPRTIIVDGAAPTTSSPYYDSINIVIPTVK